MNRKNIEIILSKMTLEEKIALCSGKNFWETKGYKKYGIPSMQMCDGPHGLRKQKKGINIDKLAEKDSKIAYIGWAVKFLNDQGKESYTRKLESYYIPEIMQAYEQYQKVKSFHGKEMTTEAKKHYEKIVDLSYKVANVEVKKAAGEIVMDMDCNADVCEDIYRRDGYCSMQEEIQESHTVEKKKEQTLHAKTISKDTYVFWTSEE